MFLISQHYRTLPMLKIQSIHIDIALILQSKTGVSVCSFQCHLLSVSHVLIYDAIESVGTCLGKAILNFLIFVSFSSGDQHIKERIFFLAGQIASYKSTMYTLFNPTALRTTKTPWSTMEFWLF